MRCDICTVPEGQACRGERNRHLCRPKFQSFLRGLAGEPDRPPPGTRVLIRTHLNSFTGYGQFAGELGRALERAGVAVAYFPTTVCDSLLPLDEWVQSRVAADPPDRWVLQVLDPQSELLPDRATVVYTMWETTRLPEKSYKNLNSSQAVIVPCDHNADTFSASGVETPIHVVPLGVDSAVFQPGPGPAGGSCRFGASGRLLHVRERKDVEGVIRAFRRAFPKEPDVQLDIKIWPDDGYVDNLTDPRIQIIAESWTVDRLVTWYRSLDAFVSGSKGEGFGLQPLQAMACGIPVIAAPYSGHAMYLDGGVGYPVRFTRGPARTYYAGLGTWAEPDLCVMAGKLREVYGDRTTAKGKGGQARERAIQFNWDRTARELLEILGKIGMILLPYGIRCP